VFRICHHIHGDTNAARLGQRLQARGGDIHAIAKHQRPSLCHIADVDANAHMKCRSGVTENCAWPAPAGFL
jgi:hypothetical protein